ncbi:tRNA dihydrouridine synthase DusB [Breznakiella homolactica]|uniref:tRNA-dihydrouridine synthase n=1 Tax=Breznakiella homolactica TaxID=2798577 RepID=A0A7T8B9M8_9SPIR|nr:tRNA dihydrouridine synthase DusB [Breznakiella homolactica]QQO09784.1 tRNA dihydrouridine synthase DusB [Breznakiella homolactica]
MESHTLYRPVAAGSLIIPGNLFLAPTAGYSDRAFRSVCVDLGADFTCTELVSSEALVRDSAKTEVLLRRADNEKQYAIQLFGADPEHMYRAAALLAPHHPEAVDINAGCPVTKVVKTGAGAALTRNPDNLGRIIEAVVRASRDYLGNVPVTVKMRSGWDADSINYRESSRIAVEAGVSLVALHPRTRAQIYSGVSNWDHIGDLASRLTVPVIGSGDLFTPEDGERMLRETRCAGVMFARGAMGNPFIFSAARSLLRTGTYRMPDPAERLKTGFRQLLLSAEDIGERTACREMRKQFCAYTKGIPGGAGLRNSLVRAETIGEYRRILLDAGIPLRSIK